MWWLLACADPDAVRPLPARAEGHVKLGAGSGTIAWRATDRLAEATFTLPIVEGPPRTDGRFQLDDTWIKTAKKYGRLRAYRRPLPFPSDARRPNYAPMGARLFRGGEEIPYVNDAGDLRGVGWFLDDGDMVVLTIEDPGRWTPQPVLVVDELAEAVARRDGQRGTPIERVRVQVTEEETTREGLHLPPGGCVAFELAVPAGSTLEWGVAPHPDPLGLKDEGTARAIVRLDGAVLADVTVADGWNAHSAAISAASDRARLELCAEGAGHVVFTNPTLKRPATGAPRRMVVIGVDTLRQDTLGVHGYARPTSPELDRWAAQMVVFDAAWAPAPRTRPSFRTAFTGVYPLAAARALTLAERLRPLGFRTGGFAANVHLVPRFGFDDGFEEWTYENGASAQDQVDRALAWLKANSGEDALLFVHIMDPHTFYDAPAPFGGRFQEASRPRNVPAEFDRWFIYELMKRRDFGVEQRTWIRAAYDGEVAYLSSELDRLFAALDSLPGETLTVLHTDHGEEFWEHGGYEHNHSLYDELVRAAFWIRPPGGWRGGPHRVKAPVGLIDLVPTVLDALGLPATGVDGTSLLPFVEEDRDDEIDALETRLEDRPLALGHLMFDTERWGVVFEGWKYVLHTWSGREELYDLAADPGERNEVSAGQASRMATMRGALQRATGWPVRGGWRIELDGDTVMPFQVAFPTPVASAGILDPEAERETRANLEWGERPLLRRVDLGTASLSDDGLVATFRLNPVARDKRVFITCAEVCPETGTLITELGELPFHEGRPSFGAFAVRVFRGTVLEQREFEAEFLAAPDPSDADALRQLGYIDGAP